VAIAVAVIVLLLLKDVDLAPFWTGAVTAAPFIAAVIALLSFALLAVTSYANWRASRHQATLEAWNAWSKSSMRSRRLLSARLGLKVISDEQAHALAHEGVTLTDVDGNSLSTKRKQKVLDNMVHVLNGLERLAVGVELGIYRRDVLILVGGTIIKRTYERFEPYIEIRRTTTQLEKRQERAFAQLSALVSQVRSYEVDVQRLQALRRQS
jgi:hypothetical protein